ncbi:hypothetical protein DENSPDRAFT_875196 [Dentipellis sp. KUC8613]|nr:hypothetical protein DENSPDRAFT_875196 [Dentipellis sp. KUC8613]
MAQYEPTETILGKRKARDDLVLHLSATSDASETDYDYPAQKRAGSSKVPIIVNGKIVENTKKRYHCTFDGCKKAYSKPSRLEEHERSHTGERPYVCTTCSKSYLRETHLQAHARSHLPQSERPFACDEPDCDKRFWTAQHLKAHEDVIHKGEKPFKCTSCPAAFLKHHQLRAHAATEHAPPGTKPYQCEHEGCTKSFSTNQKLRTHAKVHNETRYTCSHDSCLSAPSTSSAQTFYPTWTALQHHVRTAHPPTCSHPSCNGKVFTTQKGLRAHMKIHDLRDAEDAMHVDEASSDEDDPPQKRRRGGELGRDWKCEEDGCEKDFKSKMALMTHHNITHLGRRDFVCPHEECKRAFGYKHLLQRHLSRLHRKLSGSSSGDEDGGGDADASGVDGEVVPPRRSKKISAGAETGANIDAITGKGYEVRAASSRLLQCPYPAMHGLEHALGQLAVGEDEDEEMVVTMRGGRKPCEYVFNRAYDLRRHLQAVHRVVLAKEEVDKWAKGVRG